MKGVERACQKFFADVGGKSNSENFGCRWKSIPDIGNDTGSIGA